MRRDGKMVGADRFLRGDTFVGWGGAGGSSAEIFGWQFSWL